MSIIDTIDNAVRGWATSDDAMRWTPGERSHRPTARIDVRLRTVAIYDRAGKLVWRWRDRPERTSRMRRAYRVKRGGRW